MRVTFLGTSDAWCSCGASHGSLLVDDSNGRLLFECGPTVPHLLKRTPGLANSVDTIVVSHRHGDHMGGLPMFLFDLAYNKPSRTVLEIVGPPGLEQQVRTVLAALYPDLEHLELPARFHERHAGERYEARGRVLSSWLADHMRPPFEALCWRLHSDGKVVAFTGDTGPRADVAALAADADLLVCECTQPERPAGAPPEQHMSIGDIRRLRPHWRARQVYLTHMSEESRAQAQALAGSLSGLWVASDGDVVEL